MIKEILQKNQLSKEDIIHLLNIDNESDMKLLVDKAYEVKENYIGKKSYYRGLIELSNVCVKDCYYCGIRKSDNNVQRFNMTKDEIMQMAKWAYENNYASIVLQSGERADEQFVSFIEDVIKTINEMSNNGLGITLSLGEQSYETYKKWFAAGSHRYLLRIETTNENLYKNLHPSDELHNFNDRLQCLKHLREVGYQVGTGVMIGLPNQTTEDLANDILFYEKMDIDMIGMGPYIVSKDTPMGVDVINKNLNTTEMQKERVNLALKMIAVTRIYLKDVNIAATTALQSLDGLGREKGLKAGANILMPIITLEEYRAKYQLYDNKPCIEDNSDKCKVCLTGRVKSVGETVGFGERGDSPHFEKRIKIS